MKKRINIEDYLVLLFLKKPELEGLSVQTVLDEMNKEFNTSFSYRHLSLVYEPIIEFEVIEDNLEDEDYFEGY